VIPQRSPYGLIQEDLWPDEWKCIVACLMLNCTTRRQVEKILPEFFKRWPDPSTFLTAKLEEVMELISSLGFQNRRAKRLFEMTEAYQEKKWKHAAELPGVGEYAARAWEIFFKNELGKRQPVDGALALYWKWRTKHGY
jgi:methyl-CpG-binding domain protein 4